MQCLKRSKSKQGKGLVVVIAALVRNAGLPVGSELIHHVEYKHQSQLVLSDIA
jgi:hypothetical protein